MTQNNREFSTDIFNSVLQPPSSSKFSLVGLKTPTNQDVYFMSKWHEIFERYASARIFVMEALKSDDKDWEHWFNLTDNDNTNGFFITKLKTDMYETALVNYNMLVDLSWTITYVSAEYILYKWDDNGNITNSTEVIGVLPIEEAYKLLREEENLVTSPLSEHSQFLYLQKMCPEYSKAIDMIRKFWASFSNSNIRSIYNYMKHKGKPIYQEMIDYDPSKLFTFTIGDKSFPSDIRDVQRVISLEEGLDELIRFDDEQLFPYLTELISELKRIIDPSPMIL